MMRSLGHIVMVTVLLVGALLAKSLPDLARGIMRSADPNLVVRSIPTPTPHSLSSNDRLRASINEMLNAEFLPFGSADNVEGATARVINIIPVPASHRVIAFMPEDEVQYRNIFGSDPTVSQLNEIRSGLTEVVSNASGNSADDVRITTRADFIAVLDETPDSFVTIIAHNDHGMLRFPNGDVISVHEATESCTLASKRCIFIACEASQYAYEGSGSLLLRSNIRFRDAAILSRHLNQIIMDSSSSEISMRETTTQLQAALNHGELAIRFADATDRYAVPGALVGSGYATYVIVGEVTLSDNDTDAG